MCGIAGFYGFEDKRLIIDMCKVIAHRGPDQKGIHIDRRLCLGHQRLSIIDLSENARQPMSNEDGTVWITFNGEIYNFQRLAKAFEKKHRFRSRSDTEVLLHAYEEYGPDFVKKLDGIFAFAIWDSKQKKLILFRDRVGIKPLYYWLGKDSIVFSSEIKPLLLCPKIEPEIDYHVLNEYLTFRHSVSNDTIFKGIKTLPPGSYLVYQPGFPTKTISYWSPDYSVSVTDERIAEKKILSLLNDSVRDQMMADVPIGAYLSGGLDSSAVVSLMSRFSDSPIRTFSVGFGSSNVDELKFARIVADKFGTDHHEIQVSLDSAAEFLPEVVWHLDEPLGDGSVIPTYLMAKATHKHVKVVLSGEGSDELFAGYEKYKYLKYGRALRVLPSWIGRLAPSQNLKRAAAFASQENPALAYSELISVFSKDEKAKLLNYGARQAVGNIQYPDISKYFASGAPYINNLLNFDLRSWLPNDILLKSDKMSMAHSVEVRVPFLSNSLIDYSTGISPSLKLKGLQDKYIYRKAVSGIIPKVILKRKKQGFRLPISLWMKEGLDKSAMRLFSESSLFNMDYVRQIISKHDSSLYYRRQFIALLMFQLWYNTFIVERSFKRPLGGMI